MRKKSLYVVRNVLANYRPTERPSALVDLNNNYGTEPDKCVFFHNRIISGWRPTDHWNYLSTQPLEGTIPAPSRKVNN